MSDIDDAINRLTWYNGIQLDERQANAIRALIRDAINGVLERAEAAIEVWDDDPDEPSISAEYKRCIQLIRELKTEP